MSPRHTTRHRTEPMGAAQVSPALSDADRVRLLGALTPSEVYLSADLATSDHRYRSAVSADADPPGSRRGGGAMRTALGWLALLAWAGLIAHCATGEHVASYEHPTTEDGR